ncbi:MAG: ATP-grasp domain-containing protein [Polyangiales bacterium]
MAWSDLRWFLQTGLGSARDHAALTQCLDDLGVSWSPVVLVPFSDEVPDVPTDGLAVFYGATTLVRNVARAGRWRPGVYFDEARFAFEALRAGYGDDLLNADSEVLTVQALLARDTPDEAEFFVRPAADLKEFTGGVMRFGALRVWGDGLAGSVGPLSLDTRVQLATPKHVRREWRTILVGGRVVAASQYRTAGRLDVRAEVPDAVRAFAETCAARYAPAPVFTLDVGETAEGLRVVETNCFHSSGFYACDVRAIARAVTAWVVREG